MKTKSVVFCTLLLAAQFSSMGAAQEAQPSSGKSLSTGRDKPSSQDTGSPLQDPELEAIGKTSVAFVSAFDKADAKAVAAQWTEDGEYINDSGQVFKGRTAIEEEYARFFAEHPGAKMRIAVDALRRLSPNSAVEEGRAVVEPDATGAGGMSQYTAFHVQVNGKWLMAMVRDTRIETRTALRSAADLDWLVGAWVAEERGVRTESACRWVADGHFIQREYTTTQLDGTKTSGVQLIGWNPQGEYVQSWDFSPDGGHAVGVCDSSRPPTSSATIPTPL